ncbi:hypothetical protein ACF073_07375 [Streptomyces sp. NPDC015171]|uniref:hypothetical protein n=1 Tax=Streptomyces sp. NPDC015171 TaxID=3364945 RepID=UPI0036FCB930
MTVSQIRLTSAAESRQQRLHWLSEHVLDWSGVPVVHVGPTVFMENPLFTTFEHIATMARLHHDNRYDRTTNDIPGLLGRPPLGFDPLLRNTPAA